MWAEWLLPCIPNTCKITGATQRPFPTQRPYTLFFSSSFFSTSFLYQSSPVSTSFSLSVVDHLILWGLRLRVGNLFFFHRCSSPSVFSSPFYVGSSASLRPGYSPIKALWIDWIVWSVTFSHRRHFDTSSEDCVSFTIRHAPSDSRLLVICPLDHWTHLNVIQLETAS